MCPPFLPPTPCDAWLCVRTFVASRPARAGRPKDCGRRTSDRSSCHCGAAIGVALDDAQTPQRQAPRTPAGHRARCIPPNP
jgi:hypothetical protein